MGLDQECRPPTKRSGRTFRFYGPRTNLSTIRTIFIQIPYRDRTARVEKLEFRFDRRLANKKADRQLSLMYINYTWCCTMK